VRLRQGGAKGGGPEGRATTEEGGWGTAAASTPAEETELSGLSGEGGAPDGVLGEGV